jgi:hypothetical protein
MYHASNFEDWIVLMFPFCLLAIPAAILTLFLLSFAAYFYHRLFVKEADWIRFRPLTDFLKSFLIMRRILLVAVAMICCLIIGYSTAAGPVSRWQQSRIHQVLSNCTSIQVICCCNHADPANSANPRYLETDPLMVRKLTHEMEFTPSLEPFVGGMCGCATEYVFEFREGSNVVAHASIAHGFGSDSLPIGPARFTPAYSIFFDAWLNQRCPMPRQ